MIAWADPVDRVPGLGAQRSEFLMSQGLTTVGDLLLRAPLRFIDRRISPDFAKLTLMVQDGATTGELTAIGTIESFGEKGPPRKKRLIVYITDGTGHLQAVWFNNYKYYLPKIEPDRLVALTGKVSFFDGPQMVHPSVTFLEGDVDLKVPTGLIPLYPGGEEWTKVGLTRRQWPSLVKRVIDEWDGSGPYVPEETRTEYDLATFAEAIKGLHLPQTTEEYDRAIRSLKFAELFHHQLLMVLLRRRRKQSAGVRVIGEGSRYRRFVTNLPFELSEGQKQVLTEISDDLGSGTPMYRLMQGEVGAGKTVVALASAALAADAGYQAALMAPTELLARQHFLNAMRLCEPAGLKSVLLTAGRSADELREAHTDTLTGDADIVIGTHALFQQQVRFRRLGLVIIDEQQRFGVRQRAMLVGKGVRPHVLLMTATPIPRTLALAHYGDLEMSLLLPLPHLSRQIKTRVVNEGQRDKVFGWLKGKLKTGNRGYLILPVIDEGPAGLEAAQARFDPYSRIDFKGIPMALLHGRQVVEERVRAMEAFRRGEVRLLMATAVVEVGVDVPEASLMVIENAERFGLAQLHQLRGRVGRLGQPGFCILLTRELPNEAGFERLKRLEQCDDGLTLAEEDLKLRGSGEPLGARQSGAQKFKLADLSQDWEILSQAHRAAESLIDRYPDLAPFHDLRAKVKAEYRARPRTIMAG